MKSKMLWLGGRDSLPFTTSRGDRKGAEGEL